MMTLSFLSKFNFLGAAASGINKIRGKKYYSRFQLLGPALAQSFILTAYFYTVVVTGIITIYKDLTEDRQ